MTAIYQTVKTLNNKARSRNQEQQAEADGSLYLWGQEVVLPCGPLASARPDNGAKTSSIILRMLLL